MYLSLAFLLLAQQQQQQQQQTDSVVVTGTYQPIGIDEMDRAVRSLPVRKLELLSITLSDFLRLDSSLDLRSRARNGLQADLSIRGGSFGWRVPVRFCPIKKQKSWCGMLSREAGDGEGRGIRFSPESIRRTVALKACRTERVCVVNANRNDDRRWNVNVNRLGNENRWNAENRVFSRNSSVFSRQAQP